MNPLALGFIGTPSSLVKNTNNARPAGADMRSGVITAVSTSGVTVSVGGGTENVTASYSTGYSPAVGDTVTLIQTQGSWMVLGRAVGSGTAQDGSGPGPTASPTFLAGLETARANANLAVSTGTAVTVSQYAFSYYHPPGHKVLIWAHFYWLAGAAADAMVADLTETTSGLALGEITEPPWSNSFGRASDLYGWAPDSLGGAERTIAMTVNRIAGTGSITVQTSLNRQGFMLAIDLGDVSMYPTHT